LMVSACGGDAKPPTTPSAAASVSGAWQGTLASPVNPLGNEMPLFMESSPVSLDLTQSGLAVTGTVRLKQDDGLDLLGTLTGTLANAATPTTLEYAVSYGIAENQCKATFSGTLNVSTRELVGSVRGQNCVRDFTGTLRATKAN
jgi:hypothetical protein